MNSKINAMRALAAYSARQSLRLVTLIFTSIALIVAASVIALAYVFTAWWLILLLPVMLLYLGFLILRAIANKIIVSIHRHPFTRTQREELEKFTGRLKGLADIKNTPVFIFALMTIWDTMRHRDETAIQKLVDSSKILKEDFAKLERYFGER